jgi:hypothetical protein
MNINGRLLLLVVATGLFVRVWMVNDRPRSRNHAPMRTQTAIRMPPPDPTLAVRAGEVVARPISIVSQPAVPVERPLSTPHSPFRFRSFLPALVEETWTESNCPVPLPAGICSGVYRVADDTGRVARLVIAVSTAVTVDAVAPVVDPDLYMMTVGSSRWYFIRLQQMSVAELPAVPPPDQPAREFTVLSATGQDRPWCTNRKFDFTGYVPLGGSGAPDAEEIAHPEPPDLPVPR